MVLKSIQAVLLFLVITFSPNCASALASEHSVYAGPLIFGPYATVASHIGSVDFEIKVDPIGKTVVVAEVEYINESGKKVTKSFHGKTSIQTGNSIANVRIRLKGVPTGSACRVTVSP